MNSGFLNPGGDETVTGYEYLDSAFGYFAMRTQARIVIARFAASLEYLPSVGVENIPAYRQPLIDYLQDELPAPGYAPVTPRDAGSSIVSFRMQGDPAALYNKLRTEGITITVSQHYLRVAISVFNNHEDVETLVTGTRVSHPLANKGQRRIQRRGRLRAARGRMREYSE